MGDSQTYHLGGGVKYLSTIHEWNKENNCCDKEKLDFKIFEFVLHSWVTVESFIYFDEGVYAAWPNQGEAICFSSFNQQFL